MPLSNLNLSDKKITRNFTTDGTTVEDKKLSQTNKTPSKLTLSDVVNTLKVSYHKNNNARKAPNPYLNLMFQNLSVASKPQKVVDDKIFELLNFARIVNVWVRRNMPLAPCNKEIVQQFDNFELSLAAADYIFSKYKNSKTPTIDIKKTGGGTCGHFTDLALDAMLSHGEIDNISAHRVKISNKDDSYHIFSIIMYRNDKNNAVVIDAHSENAEPCLLSDIKDKLKRVLN
jgi:hypothetical protein